MKRFSTGLLLGIAYSASIGGIATLIGTPPNLSFARIFAITFPDAPEIDFVTWFIFALPLSLVLLALLWFFLAWRFAPRGAGLRVERSVIETQYRALGKTTYEQWIVLVLFQIMALLWLSRSDLEVGAFTIPGWSSLLPEPGYVRDGTVAVATALLLFCIPSRSQPGRFLLDWDTAKKMPWDILLLFGGGFALAQAFADSGLALWIGGQLTGMQAFSPLLMIFIICLCVSLLTELTSNAATAEMLLPIMAAFAVAIGIHPLFIMIPVTITCSCAFMLPVATPPNAIIFASDRLRVSDMARNGFVFNCIAVVLICVLMKIWGGRIFGIDLAILPDWAHL